MSSQKKDMEALAALAGTWAGLAEAGRNSGAGMRTVGRRSARRARRAAALSGDRALLAYHALRGELPPPPRRTGSVVGLAILSGAAGAVAALGIRQAATAIRARKDRAAEEPPGTTPTSEPSPNRAETGSVNI
jgi:hypothetical protein